MSTVHTIQTISLPTQTRPSSPISHLTDFPNICMELDGQDPEIALVELHQAIDFGKNHVAENFLVHMVVLQNQNANKKRSVEGFGRSLCGINRLTHIVNEKRYMWDTIDLKYGVSGFMQTTQRNRRGQRASNKNAIQLQS